MASPRVIVHATLQTLLAAAETNSEPHDIQKALDALVAEYETPPVAVFKIDQDRRMVWGWASVATRHGQPVVDLQQDVVGIEDLREAAHEFMGVRKLGRMHETLHGIGDVRESIVFDKALQDALGIDLGMEGWFVGVHVTDEDTWQRVRSGELRAFSVGGTGVREVIE
jgi:hypothetical protein